MRLGTRLGMMGNGCMPGEPCECGPVAALPVLGVDVSATQIEALSAAGEPAPEPKSSYFTVSWPEMLDLVSRLEALEAAQPRKTPKAKGKVAAKAKRGAQRISARKR
jgi:hypothetical protein